MNKLRFDGELLKNFLSNVNFTKRAEYIRLATKCSEEVAEFVAECTKELLDADIVHNLELEFDNIDLKLLKRMRGIDCLNNRYLEVVNWV